MYKTYKFLLNNVYVVGDLHGEFQLLKYKIRENKITDAFIIVAGDCGFGFEKPEYYRQVYNKMLKVLSKQNVTILFVRGNHDDPEYFNGKFIINYKYFKTIPDYSILTFGNENTHNILCVGGAISIDRRYRKNEESKYTNGKRFYWENEQPVYLPEVLDKINEDGIKIETVITHSSPTFAPLTNKGSTENFIIFDNTLENDINNERLVITQIYEHIVKKDKHNVKNWFYGHFHQHSLMYSDDDVKFVMLDMFRTRNNCWDIYEIRI